MTYPPGYGPFGYCPALYGRRRAEAGAAVIQTRRCESPGCRKETAGVGPAAKYCAVHAEVSTRKAKREYQRKYRDRERQPHGSGVEKLTAESGVLP